MTSAARVRRPCVPAAKFAASTPPARSAWILIRWRQHHLAKPNPQTSRPGELPRRRNKAHQGVNEERDAQCYMCAANSDDVSWHQTVTKISHGGTMRQPDAGAHWPTNDRGRRGVRARMSRAPAAQPARHSRRSSLLQESQQCTATRSRRLMTPQIRTPESGLAHSREVVRPGVSLSAVITAP